MSDKEKIERLITVVGELILTLEHRFGTEILVSTTKRHFIDLIDDKDTKFANFFKE